MAGGGKWRVQACQKGAVSFLVMAGGAPCLTRYIIPAPPPALALHTEIVHVSYQSSPGRLNMELSLPACLPGDFDLEGRHLDYASPIVTVYVGNLAPTVDEQALAAVFHPFGHITNVQVPSAICSHLHSAAEVFLQSSAEPITATVCFLLVGGCARLGW